MNSVTQWLYVLSTALLTPVLVALLALLAWTLVLLGGFLKELLARPSVRRDLEAAVAAAKTSLSPDEAWTRLARARSGLPRIFCARTDGLRSDGAVLSKALVDLENDVASVVATLSFCTRVAPMLGLMGTLIPLGPALMGLASGNVAEMARNLVVAFTATVVGLLVSGATYGIGLARRTWYARDVSDLEFLSQRLAPVPGRA